MNKRTEILETAIDLCNGDREKDYGSPEESFYAVAQMWSAYLGHPVEARDVCNMMTLLKIARLRNGPHHDSSVDGASYLALGAEVSED
jgi:hypothetical protein